jgi:hypothetical protein
MASEYLFGIFKRSLETFFYGTVHQLSKHNETVLGQNRIFSLCEITGPQWLELLIARTHFDSPFEFEPVKFYCTWSSFQILANDHFLFFINLSFKQVYSFLLVLY